MKYKVLSTNSYSKREEDMLFPQSGHVFWDSHSAGLQVSNFYLNLLTEWSLKEIKRSFSLIMGLVKSKINCKEKFKKKQKEHNN